MIISDAIVDELLATLAVCLEESKEQDAKFYADGWRSSVTCRVDFVREILRMEQICSEPACPGERGLAA